MHSLKEGAAWALFAAGLILALPGNLASIPGRWLMAHAETINADIEELSDELERERLAAALIGGRL